MKKFDVMFGFAGALRELSTCKRAKCAAIVFPMDCSTVYSIGYNGQPTGTDNEACRDEAGNCYCIHAEANAIAKLDSQSVRDAVMYSTTMPCPQCAGLIANSGAIKLVTFHHEYRVTDGMDILLSAGIACVHRSQMQVMVKDIVARLKAQRH